METEDGFILGVYNYCDRWCEYCPFTGRCHVFADGQEIDFEIASGKSVREAFAAQHARMVAALPAGALTFDGLDEVAETVPPQDEAPEEHRAIEQRASDYGLRVWAWLKGKTGPPVHTPAPSALDIVEHFAIYVGAKIHRAVYGLSFDADERADAHGSAKAGLLGIERSHAAWLDLVASGRATDAQAAPFVADLVWLADALERALPAARQFVRPGFDEPEAVARLEASER